MHDVYYLNSGPMMGRRALGPCTTTKQKETADKHFYLQTCQIVINTNY